MTLSCACNGLSFTTGWIGPKPSAALPRAGELTRRPTLHTTPCGATITIQSLLNLFQPITPPRPDIKRTAGAAPSNQTKRWNEEPTTTNITHPTPYPYLHLNQNEEIPTVSLSPTGVCKWNIGTFRMCPLDPSEGGQRIAIFMLFSLTIIFDADFFAYKASVHSLGVTAWGPWQTYGAPNGRVYF